MPRSGNCRLLYSPAPLTISMTVVKQSVAGHNRLEFNFRSVYPIGAGPASRIASRHRISLTGTEQERLTLSEARRSEVAKITKDHQEKLKGLSTHDTDIIGSLVSMQLDNIEESGLDPKTHALVRIAALVTLDAAPASFMWQIGMALESGVTPDEILGVLIALAPTIGMARIVAAAPEVALALGLDIEALLS